MKKEEQMNKQTAVEFYDQVLRKCLMGTVECDPNQILEDANQLFKEQIMRAYENGVSDENESNLSGLFTNAEQYYNETYNK